VPLIQPRLLKGFRDSLPQVMIARKRMIETVTRVFESFGFVPLETPALEYADILLGKYGADGEKLLYRFQDNGGRDVALRSSYSNTNASSGNTASNSARALGS